jgi:hypothetical protein
MRNFGIKLADTPFTNIFDDDEILPPKYLQQTFDYRNKYHKEIKKDFLLAPTIMYRKT